MIALAMDDLPDRSGDEAPRSSEELRLRRERRRGDIRRRRLSAVAFLLGVVGIVAAAALLGPIGGDSPGTASGEGMHSSPAAATDAPASEDAAGPVRNARPQADWRPHEGPVPIIEYHVIGAAPADAPYPELYVTRPDFHGQMDWLDRHGFEAVTLETVQDAWYRGGTLPKKPVVISFDDGYRPQFTYALPELRRHGWPGLLNLKAEGSDLYDSNVEAMLEAGWELASHTIDHSDLTSLDPASLRREVAGSRRILKREYGVPVENFCYPAGHYDETVIAAVEAAGYEGATSQIPGYAERGAPYELARLEVLGSSGLDGFARLLASG
jgi:peptidoglycan/xylan/chitin deacetylase (PgdA/CDA1 family)